MSVPEDCLTDHLYLLIGGNPLPNYVAARLLLKTPGSKIHLVHTTKVVQIADALTEVLKDYGLTNIKRVEVLEVGEREIAQVIEADLKKIKPNESVGLHYTGGTKAMVAHSYYILRTLGQKTGQQAVFSYLDARTMTMHLEPLGQPPQRIPLADWPLGNPPTIRELAKLHGKEVKDGSRYEPTQSAIANELAHFCSVPELAKQWNLWRGQLRDERNNPLPTVSWPSITHPDRGNLGTILAKCFGQIGKEEFDLRMAATKLGLLKNKDFEKVNKWLHGLWLETYVLDAVHKHADTAKLHDYGGNLLKEKDVSLDFEVDVFAMRSYRLFIISCTTDTKHSLCKSKLFEALIRADQLGGSEARVALVSLYEDSTKLRNEVIKYGRDEDQVQVYGPGALPKLPELLQHWFKTGE